jgi:hypothetical protein
LCTFAAVLEYKTCEGSVSDMLWTFAVNLEKIYIRNYPKEYTLVGYVTESATAMTKSVDGRV